MPVKLYYTGHAVLYPEQSEKSRNALRTDRYENLTEFEWMQKEVDYMTKKMEGRNYTLNFHNRNQLIGSAIYGHRNKKNNILFLTLTYQYGRGYIKKTDKEINSDIRHFLDNLRHNYGLGGYTWTKEFTKRKAPHYHIILDSPYVPINEFNNIWCRNRGHYSANAVSHDKENGLIVQSPERAGHYIAKYITKCKDVISKSRVFAISNGWQIHPKTFTEDYQIKEIIQRSEIQYKGEYTTILKLPDFITQKLFEYDT